MFSILRRKVASHMREAFSGFLIVIALGASVHAQDVRIAANIPSNLPQTTAMKLAGSIESYIRRECGKDFRYLDCSIFVQPDPKGSLIGYLKIYQMPKGTAVFETDTLTSDGRTCLIGGNIDGERLDTTADFEHGSLFETKDGVGMYHFERVGPRIRITDERWNYCYRSRHIDDVWFLIGTARL
jgi:hypothetical protein